MLRIDFQVRIKDDMLQYRGPNVFKGYWKQPEKTKQEFTSDGFFISGDMASIDENGCPIPFYIISRIHFRCCSYSWSRKRPDYQWRIECLPERGGGCVGSHARNPRKCGHW